MSYSTNSARDNWMDSWMHVCKKSILPRAISLIFAGLLLIFFSIGTAHAKGPNCSRSFSLALHDHGLLYSADTNMGIDKDIAEELTRRSGCKIVVSLMPRARIWQLIESGALDFSLSGITNTERDRFAAFAWYVSNKYYLLTRKDANIRTVADFENNDKLQLGVIRSFRYSPRANQLVDQLQAANRISQAGGLSPLYQLLMANRIQGMIIEPFDYPALEQKQIRDVTTIVEFNDPPVPHGLIMSKKSLSALEREQWLALVNDMRSDGALRRIFEKYFQPELAATMTNFQSP